MKNIILQYTSGFWYSSTTLFLLLQWYWWLEHNHWIQFTTHFFNTTIFTRMQDDVLSLNLASKHVRSSYIRAWNTEPDHAKPTVRHWTTQSHTKSCIAQLSCVNKRQNTAWLKVTDTIFFFGTLSIVEFFTEARPFRSQLRSNFQAKKHPPWLTP